MPNGRGSSRSADAARAVPPSGIFVREHGSDQLATIGKAYTGLTDAEIAEMTALLLDITVADHGHYRTVEPRIVLEIAFDAVQSSARHACTQVRPALHRFPGAWRSAKHLITLNFSLSTTSHSLPIARLRHTQGVACRLSKNNEDEKCSTRVCSVS